MIHFSSKRLCFRKKNSSVNYEIQAPKMSQGADIIPGFADNIAKQQQELSQPFGMLTTMFDNLKEDQLV